MRKKEECVLQHALLKSILSQGSEKKIMDINNLLFPYHRNVPDKNGNLTVVTDQLSYNEYVNNLHIDPIQYINMLYGKDMFKNILN